MRVLTIALLCFGHVAHALAADAPVAVAEGRQPRLAGDERGNVYCLYGSGEDIFCARSEEDGASFERPVQVASLPGLMLGKRRGPRVTVAGDTVVVTAISNVDGNLHAWRSTDEGKTWSDALRVNDVDRSCREGLHDMAAIGDGTIGAVWLDLRNKGTQLWGSFSKDGGATWSKNELVYRSPDGSICQCCHPTIAASNNQWYILWRNLIEGHRDIYVSTSRVGKTGFDEPVRLGDVEWMLDACPMDGGDLAIGENGGWATWRREQTCYATDLKDPSRELTLGRGEQPTVAMTAKGPAFAWLASRPGELMFRASGAASATKIAMQASDPNLLALPDGGVLCAYESVEDGKSIVRVYRSLHFTRSTSR
jgi:hypothetical protein